MQLKIHVVNNRRPNPLTYVCNGENNVPSYIERPSDYNSGGKPQTNNIGLGLINKSFQPG